MSKSNLNVHTLTFDINAKFLRDMQKLFFKAALIDFGIVDRPPHVVEASCLFNDAVNDLLKLVPEARLLWSESGWIEDPSSSYGKLPMSNVTLLFILCALGEVDFPGVVGETWRSVHEVVL